MFDWKQVVRYVRGSGNMSVRESVVTQGGEGPEPAAPHRRRRPLVDAPPKVRLLSGVYIFLLLDLIAIFPKSEYFIDCKLQPNDAR